MPSSQHYKHILWGLSKCEEGSRKGGIHMNRTTLFILSFPIFKKNLQLKQPQDTAASVSLSTFTFYSSDCLLLFFISSQLCLESFASACRRWQRSKREKSQNVWASAENRRLSQDAALLTHHNPSKQMCYSNLNTLPLWKKKSCLCQKNINRNGPPYACLRRKRKEGGGRREEERASGFSLTGCFGTPSLGWLEYWMQ